MLYVSVFLHKLKKMGLFIAKYYSLILLRIIYEMNRNTYIPNYI